MAFKSRARVRDPPRLDDGFIHGEGTSSEGGLACLPVTMYERILTMRKMRLMRRAAPAAAQMETPDGIAAARTRTTSNATSAASIPRRESLIELVPLVAQTPSESLERASDCKTLATSQILPIQRKKHTFPLRRLS